MKKRNYSEPEIMVLEICAKSAVLSGSSEEWKKAAEALGDDDFK